MDIPITVRTLASWWCALYFHGWLGILVTPELFHFQCVTISSILILLTWRRRTPMSGWSSLLYKLPKNWKQKGARPLPQAVAFLSGFQRQLSSAVNIPVFTSTLILVPMIHTMLGPKKSIGILTECADMVSEPFFQQAGWSSRDIPVHVTGMVPDSVFSKLIIGDNPDGDWEQIELCVQEMVQRHMASYPDTVLCFWNVLILPLLQKRFKTSPQFPYLELISCCNIWIHVSMLPIIALCNRHLFSKDSVPIRNYEQLQ